MKLRLAVSTCAAALVLLPGMAFAQSGKGTRDGAATTQAGAPRSQRDAARESAIVKAPAGDVRGYTENGLKIFKGLPYAAAPVGAYRWRPPVELPAWEGIRDATVFGPACVQAGSPSNFFYYEKVTDQSEDCLSLNIWAPEDAGDAPVFFWIHGGALINGAGSRPMFDGAELARRGLVVVSINYRLGVLGYLAHPDLSAESDENVSGNYGLLDQIAALRWVKRNIAAFGGDPGNVTIAGESAGGLSVLYLLASPRARGLFHRAIAQSAYMVNTPELRQQRFGVRSAEATGKWLGEKLGAKSIEELRAMDAHSLTIASLRAGYGPSGTIDGHILPRQLVDIFDSGEQAPVPVMAGFNSGEMRTLRLMMPSIPESRDSYEKMIRASYGDLADTLLRFYSPDNIDEAMLALQRDASFGWTAERLVTKQISLGLPGYLYMFDHGTPEADEAGVHAFHASEVPYIFGTTGQTSPNWPKVPQNELELGLSRAMTGYWASFAFTGVPIAKGAPEWTIYGNDHAYMRFAAKPLPGHGLLPGHYELHEEVMCRRRAADIAWNRTIGAGVTAFPENDSGC